MSAFGLGSVWVSATRTITHASNTVGNLASATDALSQNAETNAWVAVAKSSMDLCAELGIVGKGDKPLSAVEAITASKSLLSSLRGY